jgi:hypothetical protein
LKLGGVLYVSYNTLPGWAAMVPVRNLLAQHAETYGSQGQGVASNINGAISFFEQLLGANPAFARANQGIEEKIKRIKIQNPNYLAHEYFNRDWAPMSIAQMAEWLEPAKLSYACSASYLENLSFVNLTYDQQKLIEKIEHPIFRESIRDFIVNQQFRRDYWIRGIRKYSPTDQVNLLRCQRLVLATPPENISLEFTSGVGTIKLHEDSYRPVIDILATSPAIAFHEIEQKVAAKGVSLKDLIQVVLVLAGRGVVYPAQGEKAAEGRKIHTDALNKLLLNQQKTSSNTEYLASPVTGGGIFVPKVQQLFLAEYLLGKRSPDDLAIGAWKNLEAIGQKLIKDKRVLDDEVENLDELRSQAITFVDKQATILKNLGIA